MRFIGLLAALAVASCGITPPNGATCFVDTFTRFEGDLRPVRMSVADDGRPCTFTAYLAYGAGNAPLVGGTMLAAPSVGTARFVDFGGKTLIEYQPRAGYAGPDAFTVELGQANVVLPVAVNVSPPASPPAAAAKGTPEAPYELPIADRRAGGGGNR